MGFSDLSRVLLFTTRVARRTNEANALVVDRQVSSAKAQQVLDWQPQEPSLFDKLKGDAYAIG
jgi:hypothetical protein